MNFCNIKIKTKKSKKNLFLACILMLLLVGFFVYINKIVNPLILTTNQAYISQQTTLSINNAVTSTISQTNLYENLITISKNNEGNVTLIQANTQYINTLNATLINTIITNLVTVGDAGFGVPIGCFTGIKLLNALGPKITIKTTPIGTVKSNLISTFESAGINQTIHQIYIDILANVSILLPISNPIILVQSRVLLAESIIVGNIPQTYLSGNLFASKLNLVP